MQDTGFLNPQELLSHLQIREGMTIADFGSGSGEITIIMAQAAGPEGRVTALDVLPRALDDVKTRAKVANLETIDAVRANLETPGGSTLSDSSQDIVFLGNILWQSPKRPAVITEAVRVLKPGGRMVAVEWQSDGTVGPPSHHRIGQKHLEKLLQDAGLAKIASFGAGAFHYGVTAQKP